MAEDRPWARVYRHVPLLASFAGYDRQKLRADLVAGLTTAVLLVPQGMAYALLAGLPPVMGLYAALIPALGYAFLGTSRQLSVGPVAMDSLLVAAGVGALAQAGSPSYVEAAILLALLVASQAAKMTLAQPRIKGQYGKSATFRYCVFVMLGKVPQALGVLRAYRNSRAGREHRLVEYK